MATELDLAKRALEHAGWRIEQLLTDGEGRGRAVFISTSGRVVKIDVGQNGAALTSYEQVGARDKRRPIGKVEHTPSFPVAVRSAARYMAANLPRGRALTEGLAESIRSAGMTLSAEVAAKRAPARCAALTPMNDEWLDNFEGPRKRFVGSVSLALAPGSTRSQASISGSIG